MKEVKSLFDFVNDLGHGKEYLYSDATKSKYDAFMINRAMSQHMDLIMYANQMNKDCCLDKQMQHDFYFYSVGVKKRYGKWAKASKNDDAIELIIKHYAVNRTHAQQYLELMTDDEIKELKQRYKIGGKAK